MIARATPEPPFSFEDDDLVFLLRDAPIRKLRLIQNAFGRCNAHRFHGWPAKELRLITFNACPSHVTRHRRPQWDLWTIVRPSSASIAIQDFNSNGIPLVTEFQVYDTVDFNVLPLGRRIHMEITDEEYL